MKTLQQLLMKKKIIMSIKMMKSQRSKIERNKLIEDGKRKGVNEIIRQNKTVKYQV